MSLKKIWENIHFALAVHDICTPREVNQKMTEKGWKVDTKLYPSGATVMGHYPITDVTIFTPEGRSSKEDNAVYDQYNREREKLVREYFGRAPK